MTTKQRSTNRPSSSRNRSGRQRLSSCSGPNRASSNSSLVFDKITSFWHNFTQGVASLPPTSAEVREKARAGYNSHQPLRQPHHPMVVPMDSAMETSCLTTNSLPLDARWRFPADLDLVPGYICSITTGAPSLSLSLCLSRTSLSRYRFMELWKILRPEVYSDGSWISRGNRPTKCRDEIGFHSLTPRNPVSDSYSRIRYARPDPAL